MSPTLYGLCRTGNRELATWKAAVRGLCGECAYRADRKKREVRPKKRVTR